MSDPGLTLFFREVETLPRLAWCARLRAGSEAAEIVHGPWVETSAGAFSEGAWDGDFAGGGFDGSFFTGTGGKAVPEGFLAATPDHTADRLFLLRKEAILFVSNSLYFALAQAEDALDPRYLFYDSALASIVEGTRGYARWIPTREGRRVRIVCHANVVVGLDLRVSERPKPPAPEFRDFADYTSFLLRTVTGLCANARDPRRKVRYEPVATISSGYDSPAAAVVARAAGCTEAFTFRESRGTKDVQDSGAAIGAALGVQVTPCDRLGYLAREDFPEAEFYGGPNELSSVLETLERRILFTGFHGDKVWDRNCDIVSRTIRRGDSSGTTYGEARLRVGFFHLPVPFVGCTSHPSIHRISNSKEMRPWSLMNSYDRPIPRRLLEEAGVERKQFGMKKRAVGVYVPAEGLEATMTPKSYADFALFLAERWNRRFAAKSLFARGVRFLYKKNKWLHRKAAEIFRGAFGIDVGLPVLVPRRLRLRAHGYLGREALLFHWSAEKVLPRYRIAERALDS